MEGVVGEDDGGRVRNGERWRNGEMEKGRIGEMEKGRKLNK